VSRPGSGSARWLLAAALAVPATAMATACRTAAPQLTALTPTTADVSRGELVEVVIAGRGFTAMNTVHFGPVVLVQVPRRSDRELRFMVPLDDTQQPGRGEAPPLPLPAGTYRVTVTTARGTSNALPFQLGVLR